LFCIAKITNLSNGVFRKYDKNEGGNRWNKIDCVYITITLNAMRVLIDLGIQSNHFIVILNN